MKNIVTVNQEDKTEVNNGSYFILIEIDGKLYAINTLGVLEILKLIELDIPNNIPSCILGVINYNNNPISVIDIRGVFNLKRIKYDTSSKLIIINTARGLTSIVCDKVIDIKKLEEKNIHKIPYESDKVFFAGLYTSNEKNIYILNPENILGYISDNIADYEKNDTEINYITDDEESKKVLSERRKLLNKIKDEVQINIPLYDRGVSFLINDVKYYINMASVKEFYKVNNAKFIQVPNTPDYIFGLINIKGDYITVLDIRKLFNTSPTVIKEKTTIIILNSNEYKVGILADEICESMNIDFDEIIQNRLNNQDENKMMEFVKDEEIYQVLDVETLLRDERLTIC